MEQCSAHPELVHERPELGVEDVVLDAARGERNGARVGEWDRCRDVLEAAVDLRRVMAAMTQLPDEQREVVALILVEGFGYREVSEMLGLPIGTVSSECAIPRSARAPWWEWRWARR